MPTPRFKIGDNVVCIDARNAPSLTEGYDYIVTKVFDTLGYSPYLGGVVDFGVLVDGATPRPGSRSFSESRFVKRDTAHDEHVLVEQIKQSRTIGAQS